MSTSGKPIFDGDGIFVGYRGCASDITEKKQAEERLRQSEAKLLAAQKMEAIGRLTGGVAHDFNNLLQVVMGNAEILLSDPDADRECVTAIVRAAQQGAELTGRLLSYARQQTLTPQRVDVHALLQSVSGLLKRTLAESIEVTVSRSVGPWHAFVDPNQLETALLNLALNARDAMPEGGQLEFACGTTHIDGAGSRASPRFPPAPMPSSPSATREPACPPKPGGGPSSPSSRPRASAGARASASRWSTDLRDSHAGRCQ